MTEKEIEILRSFVEWVVMRNWGHDSDGGNIQDEAVKAGILSETTYNSYEKHGDNDVGAEDGDAWFVFSDWMRDDGNGKTI